ncbi:unnamed protein product [Linum tenue]|uniref:Remorin N-terminal domain-containing protein n=1 Tax=Linum tenue TaxID=586396 RepID=A0AAV0PGE9_9ROSI|nr:unnamed protein product [Linum tenue]
MSTTFALRQRAKPRFLDDSMAEQEVKKPEAESPVVAEAPAPPAAVEEKSMVPTPEEAKPEKTHEESHALAVVEAKAPEPVPKKISGGSHDRGKLCVVDSHQYFPPSIKSVLEFGFVWD